MRMTRSRRSGFTLIEILISLSVLTIGLVGILALFPVGLQNSKQAIEDTVSANIAESVKSGIVQSLKMKPAGVDLVDFFHDGSPTGLQFRLPPTDPINMGDFERAVPQQATGPAPAGTPVFRLGQVAAGAFRLNVEPGTNRDAQLPTYYFNFRIRPTTNPAVKNTYEVVIQIYRSYLAAPPGNPTQTPINTFSTIVNTSPLN